MTADEFAVIKRPTLMGDRVRERSPSLAIARVIASGHHEQWSGAGYPDGVAGGDIPFVARLVAVVDVFVHWSVRAPVKGHGAARRRRRFARGVGIHFDPKIAAAFLDLYDKGELDDLVRAAIAPASATESGISLGE